MGITFSDQKSPKGTMSKSSVKHCRFCMTFRTKSDKMATCRFGVENVTFWTTSASSASAPAIGSKEATEPIKNDSAYNLFSTCATMSKSSVKHCRFLLQKLPKLFDFWKTTLAKTLLFLSQIDMCPFCHFWSKKPIKNVGLQTTFQHVIIL